MATLQLYTEQQIRERLINAVVARTNLTDLNDASALKRLLAAFAAEMADGYYALTRLREMFGLRAQGADLDERLFDFPGTLRLRDGSRYAIGYLQFSRATATVASVTVSAGTIVSNAEGFQFISIQDATIAASATDSNAVLARAVTTGPDSNSDIGTVTIFTGSVPAGVTSVTNVTNFRGGRDEESDEDLKGRIQRHVASLSGSSLTAMQNAVLAVEDPDTGKSIQYVTGFNDPDDLGRAYIYVDDGSGTIEEVVSVTGEVLVNSAVGGEQYFRLGAKFAIKPEAGITITITRGAGTVTPIYNTDYLVNPADGVVYFVDPAFIVASDSIEVDYVYYSGLIQLAQKTISGDSTDRITYPGMNAAGSVVRVLPVTVQDVEVDGTIYLSESAPNGVADRIAARIIDYVNTIKADAAGSTTYVIRNEIIGAIMAEPGVLDCELTAPTGNIPVPPGSIARTTAGLITFAEVG